MSMEPHGVLDALRRAMAGHDGIGLAAAPVAHGGYDTSAPPDPEDFLAIAAGLSEKRRNEFVAGRLCAARALTAAGATWPGCLAVGADRLPQWPAGWLGSISHGKEWAIAAAAQGAKYVAVGVDIQDLISPQTMTAVQPLVATEGELASLRHAPDRQHALTLLFSAKEAFYKALYPQLRTFQDFDAVAVTASAPDRVQLTLTRDWDAAGKWPAGMSVWLPYAWHARAVVSAYCLPA
ncbi:4'-phosphopantetheinyl transferase superfamily protein [Achromobacter insolitus]|uniref:4'-phosphopantetheinyl transferase family protein n=2 Tax=Achromobacter insolitus TaxID=217204 RepID=UPI002658E0B2|nr:4'-phosphopantetheinyl transferase superfamily protein [Achromobacter insolitus]WKK15144.1 4'-phosphopantetheinyl transferase superfamily protein [Achromobacter insolitus]